MAFWDKLKGELIDIIEWTDDSNDTMVYRFERYGNEIKYNAKLTVREGQVAVFINEGKLADVFAPGMHTLQTQNMPILSTLKGWKHGFESPFKAEVYFVSTRQFTDLKWGTKNPIMMRDQDFGPVRIRAFGTYVIRVTDAAKFIREIVGTDGHFTKDEIIDQLRNIVVSRFADALGEARIPVLDLAANYDEVGAQLGEKINPEFDQYGLKLEKLLLENVSLPPAVEEALDKRSSMGVIGNMNQYTQFQAANAIEDAANNTGDGGSMASGAMGAGLGFAMANQMAQGFGNQQGQNHQQAAAGGPTGAGAAAGGVGGPPPLPGGNVQFYVAVNGQQAGPFGLPQLQQMVQQGQLTPESLVWKQGMASWTAAQGVADLSSLFGASPPPLPPQ